LYLSNLFLVFAVSSGLSAWDLITLLLTFGLTISSFFFETISFLGLPLVEFSKGLPSFIEVAFDSLGGLTETDLVLDSIFLGGSVFLGFIGLSLIGAFGVFDLRLLLSLVFRLVDFCSLGGGLLNSSHSLLISRANLV